MREVDEVIAEVLVDLDRKHAEYQRLHRFFHSKDDEKTKLTYSLLIDLCNDILVRFKRKK